MCTHTGELYRGWLPDDRISCMPSLRKAGANFLTPTQGHTCCKCEDDLGMAWRAARDQSCVYVGVESVEVESDRRLQWPFAWGWDPVASHAARVSHRRAGTRRPFGRRAADGHRDVPDRGPPGHAPRFETPLGSVVGCLLLRHQRPPLGRSESRSRINGESEVRGPGGSRGVSGPGGSSPPDGSSRGL